MNEVRAYRPGLPAATVDAALRQTLIALDRAHERAVLWFAEVVRRELYRELGYASAHQYATLALGFSRNRTNQFLRLAGDLERLPRLRAAVTDGSVGWTKAQQVARIATPASEEAWVARARGATRQELADAIKARRRKASVDRSVNQGQLPLAAPAVPGDDNSATTPSAPADTVTEPITVTLTFRLTALDLARYEGLVESIKKQGRVRPEATREEVLLAALADMAAGDAVRRRTGTSPYQIVVYECESCRQARVVTSQGDRLLTAAEHAAVAENAVVIVPGKKARHGVAPGLRRFVLSRDRYRCQAPGCDNRRFLELHHILPQALGGAHEPGNLVTLCGRCHRFLHERPDVPWASELMKTRPDSPEEPGREETE